MCAGGPITVKGLHRNRGCEAINTLGIIPRYGGLIVHDCWKAYLTYTQCKHQLCGAHLLRELQAVTDSNAYPWARKMHKLLLIARRQVIQRPQQRLSMRHYKRIARCYKAILEQGRSEMPQIPPRKKGQRGPLARSDAHNLHQRLVVPQKERPALYQTRRYSLHQQPVRARYPHGQGQAEGLRMLPNRILCTRLLSNLELSADHGGTRLQPTDRHHHRPARKRRRLPQPGQRITSRTTG